MGFTGPGHARKYKMVKDPRIKSINEQLKQGKLTEARLRILFQEIIDELYAQDKSPANMHRKATLIDDNQRVFEAFWEDVYSTRILEDEESAAGDYKRALRLLGELPVQTTSTKAMHKALEKNSKSVAQWRRAASTLNIILNYLGREDAKLNLPKAELTEPTHLTLPEFKQLLAVTPDPEMKLLLKVLFGTGARMGEALAITPQAIKNGGKSLFIGKQVTRKHKVKGPKRERAGTVSVISFARDALVQWAKVEDKERFRYTTYRHITKATHKLWPNDPIKHLGPHGLRHSHAIHLLSLGETLEVVAKNLRNRIEVCQKYYTGYTHTDSSVDSLSSRI